MTPQHLDSLAPVRGLEEAWRRFAEAGGERPDWRHFLPADGPAGREQIVNLCLTDIECRLTVDKEPPPVAQEHAEAAGRLGLDDDGQFELLRFEHERYCREYGRPFSKEAYVRGCPHLKARIEGELAMPVVLKQPTAFPHQFGRFLLVKPLGSGGMGAVYLAEDTRLGPGTSPIALKIPHPRDDDPKILERFRREAELARTVHHPYVCPVYEVGVVEGAHYLTMPFIEGRPLSRLIVPQQPWEARRAATLVRRLALALQALHENGVVHRDLKPHNVMVRANEEPMLMDFGLACVVGPDAKRLTTTGKPLGTPAYMPPELVNGDKNAMCPATDVYSLGAMLYELLAGRPPFDAPDLMALFYRILTALPPPLDLPPGPEQVLERACLKALAKLPAERYPAMTSLVADLDACLEPQKAKCEHVSPEKEIPQHQHTHPATEEQPRHSHGLPPISTLGTTGGMPRYRLGQWLGEDGGGVMYAAADTQLGRLVAVKLLRPEANDDPEARRRFKREWQALGGIEHPHVVRAYDWGEEQQEGKSVLYLVMEYLSGETLADRLQREGCLPATDILKVAEEAALGLAAIHERGLVHRDIAPWNLWLSGLPFGGWQVVVMNPSLTRSPGRYMAPEQARGEPASPRADLFSLGCVLYEAATGQPAFDGATSAEAIMSITTHQPDPPATVNPAVSGGLSDLIMGLLEKDAAVRRPATARAVAESPAFGEGRRPVNPTTGRTVSKVFVSHSTQDREFVESEIVPLLRAAGLEAWYAKDSILASEQWERSILRGLRECEFFLLVMSPRSAASPWVKMEVDWVFNNRSKRVVPVLLEDCDPDDFHFGMAGIQHADFSRDREAGRRRLLRAWAGQDKARAEAGNLAFPFDEARAKEHQRCWAEYFRRPLTQAISTGNGVEMRFTFVPPGTFLMGSPKDEEQRGGYQGADDETQQRVVLTKGYLLGTHPVTRGQFSRFAEAADTRTKDQLDGGIYVWKTERDKWEKDSKKNWRTPGFDQTDDHPAVGISWNDADAFCNWLAKRVGQDKQFRLPTEAEWEWACRAGTATPFHFGPTISTDHANYNGNNIYGKGSKGVFRKQTTSVGSFPANAWGLHDCHGNVWEWCKDWYGPYLSGDVLNPTGPDTGTRRVLRGGSWYNMPRKCRSAYRGRAEPGDRYHNYGFRVLMCLD